MGCDIHLFVEKRNVLSGKWEAIKGVNEPEILDLKSLVQKCKTRAEDTTYWEQRIQEEESGVFDFLHSGRNYTLFSLLAGVRNSYGLNPIHEPKGLPSDISYKVKESSDDWGGDGHSHSYLTAKELLNFDWSQSIKLEGWVNVEGYKEFKENGSPSTWSRSVGGGGVDHVTHYDMENFIANNGEYYGFGRSPYTLVQWTLSCEDHLASFYTWSIPKLKELAGEDLESVRIVFWFDN
ncbi:hypothetical protein [Fontibacillus sp. BL9]|uniref:hypothetical protein n=1 Tax=Fontibacillus sp. BL9 TaxID=3389971 RepID=UPI00397A0B42